MESLGQRYNHKIKTPEEVARLVGERPRRRKVIMCHGVFDVVHPGHLRHLLYAKSKADVLVASLTADVHIAKGQYRPHVPQELRAINLAAFEIVDFVIIDPEPTPLKSLTLIKPDIFAKGYEYQASGLPLKTQDELEVIRGYGGEIIFTPGDYVFSSSQLIEASPPSLRIEKLMTVMESSGLTFDKLRSILDSLKGCRIHVVGDTIVDTFTHTRMIGGQTKTPTISVLFEKKTDFIGGAGIVAEHLRAAGADVAFSTVLGEDPLKDFVLDGLSKSGIECLPVIDKTRPTTNKNAIVSGGYRLLKVDTLDNRSISDEIVLSLAKSIAADKGEALVFSDFRHGIFNRRTVPTLTEAIPQWKYKVADSQVASRWGNITDFKGFDLITPNEREARFALGDQDSGIRPLAAELYDAAKCKTLILKLGERGVLTCRHGDHQSLDSFFVVDSFVDRLIDGVGAGDALLAYATLCMLVSKSEIVATILGIMAAACECEQDGNVPIKAEDVHRKLDAVEREGEIRLKPMRVVVVGLGVQGHKRRRFAAGDYVCSVDPQNPEADFRDLRDVSSDSFDAALLCVPDSAKLELLNYLVSKGKHALVEKPLVAENEETLVELERKARAAQVTLYVAYNHRFEPHFMRMRDLVASGELGRIYRCRMFYGNGTARLVRNSDWRDQGAGVLDDLGSHVLDTARFWFGDIGDEFSIVSADRFENRSPDHVVFASTRGSPRLEFEMTLLSWRNHYTCDVFAENGSAHIGSLCKWGPSEFTHRVRVLPSGRPPEQSVTLVQDDPTWALEYEHFKALCTDRRPADLSGDVWLNRVLRKLGAEAEGK